MSTQPEQPLSKSRLFMEPKNPKRVLVLGFFSTIGDIEVLERVQSELSSLGYEFDAGPYSKRLTDANPQWINPRDVDPSKYSHVVFVCGPFSEYIFREYRDIYRRFNNCIWIGINLSMISSCDEFNPFDSLFERDSNRASRPDLSFIHPTPRVPVVGLCLAPSQPEYGSKQNHAVANSKLRSLIARKCVASIEIDTRWPARRNRQNTSNPAEYESICARLDIVLTTRLHGMVVALKNGVPAIAIDPISGGGKVSQQAEAIDWPECFNVSHVSDEELDESFDRCLRPQGRELAAKAAEGAHQKLATFSQEFLAAMGVIRQMSEPKRKQPETLLQRLKAAGFSAKRWTSSR